MHLWFKASLECPKPAFLLPLDMHLYVYAFVISVML